MLVPLFWDDPSCHDHDHGWQLKIYSCFAECFFAHHHDFDIFHDHSKVCDMHG